MKITKMSNVRELTQKEHYKVQYLRASFDKERTHTVSILDF